MPGPLFTKEAIERRTFEVLAPLIGWDIVAGSLQQPAPPQPDVLCEVVGLGPRAVELVALDASDTRRRLSHMFSTKGAWGAALAKRSAAERATLAADLINAFISPQFKNDAASGNRAVAFEALQAFLLEHPNFAGKVTRADIGGPAGFRGALIGRSDELNNGPHVSASSADYWHPPQVDKITEKLRDKTYAPAAPLELFAYATHDEPDGAVGSLEAIQAAVAEHQPGSLFQRVHLFHVGFLQHICSMP